MNIQHDAVEASTEHLDPQTLASEKDTRHEWIEPRLEPRGNLSNATGLFGGFSP